MTLKVCRLFSGIHSTKQQKKEKETVFLHKRSKDVSLRELNTFGVVFVFGSTLGNTLVYFHPA
jgi:hypothetical protein